MSEMFGFYYVVEEFVTDLIRWHCPQTFMKKSNMIYNQAITHIPIWKTGFPVSPENGLSFSMYSSATAPQATIKVNHSERRNILFFFMIGARSIIVDKF